MNRTTWLLIVVSIFLASWVVGNLLQHRDESMFQPMRAVSCQRVDANCEAKFSDAVLRFQLSSPVAVMVPLVASVNTQAAITEIYVQFHMKDMDMGVQRYRLVNSGNGMWQSEIILPVCSMGRSDWVAIIEVKYKDAWWRGEFDFEASN